jgi:hypothetical protein
LGGLVGCGAMARIRALTLSAGACRAGCCVGLACLLIVPLIAEQGFGAGVGLVAACHGGHGREVAGWEEYLLIGTLAPRRRELELPEIVVLNELV